MIDELSALHMTTPPPAAQSRLGPDSPRIGPGAMHRCAAIQLAEAHAQSAGERRGGQSGGPKRSHTFQGTGGGEHQARSRLRRRRPASDSGPPRTTVGRGFPDAIAVGHGVTR